MSEISTGMGMDRRAALERITWILGGVISAPLASYLHGQVPIPEAGVAVSEAQKLLLAEAADVIIPTTDTPGAKAAKVENFIIRVLSDCYPRVDQEAFYAGLAKLDDTSKAMHGKGFMELDAAGKNGVMKDATTTNKPFFKQLKELTVTGYFTSEIGATQALEYLPFPSRFEGDVPFKPGQKAWAISR